MGGPATRAPQLHPLDVGQRRHEQIDFMRRWMQRTQEIADAQSAASVAEAVAVAVTTEELAATDQNPAGANTGTDSMPGPPAQTPNAGQAS